MMIIIPHNASGSLTRMLRSLTHSLTPLTDRWGYQSDPLVRDLGSHKLRTHIVPQLERVVFALAASSRRSAAALAHAAHARAGAAEGFAGLRASIGVLLSAQLVHPHGFGALHRDDDAGAHRETTVARASVACTTGAAISVGKVAGGDAAGGLHATRGRRCRAAAARCRAAGQTRPVRGARQPDVGVFVALQHHALEQAFVLRLREYAAHETEERHAALFIVRFFFYGGTCVQIE